ncbi:MULTISPECIES: hypothetical protein [Marinobacter]|uniref:Uncharacterized protein n=1 Tax=Marinobacter xiaoshiensis TaxID=3073652 RepID=A0ABU2HI03_9GAMM|nr:MULTISPECIES: hypothetical protein [unclassified Marinobacter]MBK1888244.1 hypothetical protein [Marinobacter sp. DY40_1A1]MDS1310703.1 hypothetical protein [Marinobacter sp. F60267]
MTSNEKLERNPVADFILILQLVAWFIALSPLFGDFTSSDAAGNGMAQGYAFIFATVPGMIFIFLSNFYLAFKKQLKKWCRVVSAINILGLLLLFLVIS